MHDENEKGILLCMQNSGREMTHMRCPNKLSIPLNLF